MKGELDREVFTALAPMTEGLSRTPNMPYNIKEQPTLTFVARQHGEASDFIFLSPITTVQGAEEIIYHFPSFFSSNTLAALSV